MRLLPAYWFLPLWIGLPLIFLCVCKGAVETTAKLTYLGRKFNWLVMLVLEVAELSLISVCHFWLHRLLVARLKLPAFPLHLIFAVVIFDVFGLALYDFEYARHNMMMVLPSYFTAYAGRLGERQTLWVDPVLFAGSRPDTGSTVANLVLNTLVDHPVLWLSIVVFLFAWLAASAYLVYRCRYLIVESAAFSVGRCRVKWYKKEMYETSSLVWTPQHPYRNFPFVFTHCLAVVSFGVLIGSIVTKSDYKLAWFPILPYFQALLLAFTHFEKNKPSLSKAEFLENVRQYLPPGRRWLDNREDPVYPAVHGDMTAFCGYNPTHADCKDYVPPETKPLTRLPNVVLIAYESLTPSFNLISKEFIREHANVGPNDKKSLITDTRYFSEEVMPNMRKLEKDAVTFSGTASLGIPTASGLVGLFTGIPPAQSYGMIVDATLTHSDDIASAVRNFGYRSLLVSSAEFTFDGQSNWFFKRPAREEALNRLKCIEGQEELLSDPLHMELLKRSPSRHVPKLVSCSEKKVAKLTKKLQKRGIDVPKWYDAVYNYYPLGGMAELLNLSESSIRTKGTTWPADRLTAAMFKRHWQQQREIMNRNGESKPIFGTYITIESHLPYFSYDKEEYYDPISEEAKKSQDTLREARFVRVNKYADRYGIKEVFDFLREHDPNTIFVITGDHGTRDIPIRDSDSPVVDDIVYSSDCVHHSSGTDSFYITSSMIGYLGDDPVIRRALGLDKVGGKVVKVPNDHGDVAYTLLDILARINGTSLPPTHRRGRNLMDLATNLFDTIETEGVKAAVEEIDKSRWRGISSATFNLEYREGMRVLRSHPGDPSGAHFYNQTSFPLCMRKKSEPPMKLGTAEAKSAYKRMFKFLDVENYLAYHNRMYNYNFRNETCMTTRDCRWSTPAGQTWNDKSFIWFMIKIPMNALIILAAPLEVFLLLRWLFSDDNQELIDQSVSSSEDPLCVRSNDDDEAPLADLEPAIITEVVRQ